MSILAKILERKREEVAEAKVRRREEFVRRDAATTPKPRAFKQAVRRDGNQPVRIIAEIKRASPSAGPIRPGADPVAIARAYAAAGARAISVLTDKQFFDGDLSFLGLAKAAVNLPLLRKDFLIDEYQVVEARAAGADAVLLIVAALDDAQLRDLLAAARGHDLDALVEVHDEAEADRAVAAGADLIGVNHRSLSTFEMDMGLTARLADRLPEGTVLVGESGIKTAADVRLLGAAGAHAVLVGETLMRAESPGAALSELLEDTV